MNAKQKNKIQILLEGLSEHVVNNNYFEGIDFTVQSGSKSLCGKIKSDNQNFIISFTGDIICPNYDTCCASLSDIVIKYDSAMINIRERGRIFSVIADNKNVTVKNTKEEYTPIENKLKERKYNIDINKAKKLLFELGFTAENGKIRNDKLRKYNQTDYFIDNIKDLIDNKKTLNIIDCGCGKSYLSFILNYWLWEEKKIKTQIYGIDYSEEVIKASKLIAEKVGYNNMQFICANLSDIDTIDFNIRNIDLLISLHACDTATDMALGYGIKRNASNIVFVPCCHKEFLDIYSNNVIDNLVTEGVLKARFNAILTDSIRILKLKSMGYNVEAIEFCSPTDTPKNLMIKAKKTTHENQSALHEYKQALKDFNIYPSIEYYSQK